MSTKTLCLLLLSLLAPVADAAGSSPQTFRHSDIAGVAADFSSLDVYSDGRREGSPVLVFVHGGGWVNGNKSSVQRSPGFLQHYAERGVVVVSVGLRLVKGAGTKDLSFREQATDIAAALKWVHDNIRNHNGDPRSVFLMGYSAGAHLVALVGSDPSYLRTHGLEPTFLRGVISLDVNAYDIPQAIKDAPSLGVPISPANLRRVFTSDLAMQKAASPALHVTPDRKYPPMLICYIGVFDTSPEGVFDQTLSKVQSEYMVKALRSTGSRAEIYGDLAQSHRGIMRDFGKPGDPLTAAVDRFMFDPAK